MVEHNQQAKVYATENDENETLSFFSTASHWDNIIRQGRLVGISFTTILASVLFSPTSPIDVSLSLQKDQRIGGPANAAVDVSNLLTEEQIEKKIQSSNQLKDSLDTMTLYNDLVEQKDYEGIKRAFRVPPISEIRRDARNVMKGMKGTDLKTSENAYQKLIESLEQVDLVATHGVQNKISQKEEAKLDSMYKDMTKRMEVFVQTIDHN